MKKTILPFLLLLISGLVFGQKSVSRLQGVDQEIETLLKFYKAVGLSVAVVKDDKMIYSKGFGYRDLDKKLPATENTVFPIGSTSKAFTASLLGILDSENKVSIEEKPSLYIPKLRFYNNQMDDLITIGDLLSHKSGLGNLDGSLVLFPENDRLKIMERLRYLQPNAAINDSWMYSNMGYVIAGTVAEQVTHKSWDENLKEKIFNPLNMKSSYTDPDEMQRTNNFSYGYGLFKGKTEKVLHEQRSSNSPAGGIQSSVSDMANWMRMWLNNGRFDGQQVLPENYVQNATTIHNIRPQNGSDADVYLFGDGYGWRMESFKGHYKVHHGGNTSGFSTQLVMFPNDKLGIVVLTNQHESLLPFIVADVLSNRMLNLPKTEVSKYPVVVDQIYKSSDESKGLNQDSTITHSLSEFCGRYSNKGFGTLKVVKENKSLYVIFPAFTFRLAHLYYNIFTMKGVEEIPQVMKPETFILNFSLNDEGKISALNINLQSEPVAFIKETDE